MASRTVELMSCLPHLRNPQCEIILLHSCMGVAKALFGLRTCQPIGGWRHSRLVLGGTGFMFGIGCICVCFCGLKDTIIEFTGPHLSRLLYGWDRL
ncbi:hypothetical protein R6Q59_006369 [Mikania micrantha]